MLEAMDAFLATATASLLVVLGLSALGAASRMIFGPGYADRFVALDMLTGVAVAACALTAVLTGRREFLDVGLGVALIGFLATIGFAAFLEKKEREQK